MRHFTLILTSAAAAALMAAGCHEKPEGAEGSVSLHSEAQMTLPAAATDTTISFTATADWTAAVEGGEWLSISPASGEAGEIAATLSASAHNDTEARTATVRISCGTDEATVTITQNAADGDDPEEPENPEQPTGKMPKSISMVLDEDGYLYHHDYTFGYDEEGRVVSMLFKTDNENFGWPENDYKFEYGQNTVDIDIEFRSDELSGLSIVEWTLDSEGNVINESMTQSFDGETYGPYNMNLAYNSPASPEAGETLSQSPSSTAAVHSAVAVKEMVVSVAEAGRVISTSECSDTEPSPPSCLSWQPAAISAATAAAVRIRVKCLIFCRNFVYAN